MTMQESLRLYSKILAAASCCEIHEPVSLPESPGFLSTIWKTADYGRKILLLVLFDVFWLQIAIAYW